MGDKKKVNRGDLKKALFWVMQIVISCLHNAEH